MKLRKQTFEEHILKKYKGIEIYPNLFQQNFQKPGKSIKFARKMIKEGKYKLGVQKMSEYIYNNKHTI